MALGLLAAGAAWAQGAGDEARYFDQGTSAWSLGWGTDTALTLASREHPSTSRTNSGVTNFDALWSRLYGHLRHGDRLELTVDVFLTHERRPTLFGAYARVKLAEAFGLRAGLIPLVVGAWQDRATPGRQPLIDQPLSSQYLSALRNDSVPASLEELLAQRGRGRDARYALGRSGSHNAVTLAYEHCWDTGVEAFGRLGRVRYRVALAEGTPGAPAAKVRSRKGGASVQGRLTWQATSALRLGGSYARGPYLLDDAAPASAAGPRLRDQRQELWGADARLRAGAVELHAELLRNRYDSPFVAEPLRTGGAMAEVSWRLLPQVRLAARASALRFSRVRDARGRSLAWDADAERLETGVVWRLAADRVALKAVFERTRVRLEPRRVVDVWALQSSFTR